MDPIYPCNNRTIELGYCYDLPLCGLCYGAGLVENFDPKYELFNAIVIGHVMPFISLFGIVGNVLSIFVFTRKPMRSSINTYLVALALCDLVIIITAFFLFTLECWRKQSSFINHIYALLMPLTFPLASTAQSAAVFLTVVSGVDTLIFVMASDSFRERVCSPLRARRVICYTFLGSIIFNLPRWFEVMVEKCWSVQHSTSSLDICPTDFRMGDVMMFFYTYAYTAIMAIIPVAMLIAINIIILLVIKNPCSRIIDFGSLRRGSNPILFEDVKALFSVVCVFITCNSLALVVNFSEFVFEQESKYMVDLSNTLVVCNSSINICFYYCWSTNFHKTLSVYTRKVLFRRRKMSYYDDITAIAYKGDSEIKAEDAYLL